METQAIEKFKSIKGSFLRAKFASEKKPKAASKGRELVKITEGVFRAGIDYANLGAVKEGIANGERGDVQSLPFGEWVSFPFIIRHRPKNTGVETKYLRLYPRHYRDKETGRLTTDYPSSTYFVDGNEVSKDEFYSHLPPSARNRDSAPDCITVKENGFLELCEWVEYSEFETWREEREWVYS